MFNSILNKDSDIFYVYTQGSKTNFATGSAAIIENITSQIKLSDVTTIFTAELQGILLALTNINTSHKDRLKI